MRFFSLQRMGDSMSDGIRIRDVGACVASSKSEGEYTLVRDDYEPLRQAWMRGEAFYDGRSPYGQRVTIKLGDIVSVADVAPEHLSAKRADRLAQEAEDRLDGLE